MILLKKIIVKKFTVNYLIPKNTILSLLFTIVKFELTEGY